MSDFLVESLRDTEKEAAYRSSFFVHAGLRMHCAQYDQESGSWKQLFPDMREHLRLQYKEVDESVFVYLAVVPGVPNSTKILLHVMENLTEIFIKKKGLRNVIMTADAVELNVLYKIRQDYGTLFSHFSFFFGVWHALSNYLSQFFKFYRYAGVQKMIKTFEAGSAMERIFKVTSDWSYANRTALLLAEALIRGQWEAFERHANNNIDGETSIL